MQIEYWRTYSTRSLRSFTTMSNLPWCSVLSLLICARVIFLQIKKGLETFDRQPGSRYTSFVAWSRALVMCWLGFGLKPWLWPGFSWPWLHFSQARAKPLGLGLASAWPGSSHGLGLNLA